MSFKPGDKVCLNPDYFEGSKSELIKQYGIGEITSETYTDYHIPPHTRLFEWLHVPIPIPRHVHFINVKWDNLEGEYWEYADLLYLVEERKKRDIYALFEQEMNNT